MEDDFDYMEKVCEKGMRRRVDVFDENIFGFCNLMFIGLWFLRLKWDWKDEKLFFCFFVFKLLKDVIWGVCEEVDEL